MADNSISVVISTFNRCEDCSRAVNSALDQVPAPIEVIVCDDGSTDSTRNTFERWQSADERVRYLRLDPNRGTPAPARNQGVELARGDWVAFLDDDDLWLAGKLALQTSIIDTGAFDVIATDALRSSGRAYFGLTAGHTQPHRAQIEKANPIILSTAVVRRELLLESLGFDEHSDLAGIEDYDLWLRLADRSARFVVLDATTVAYRDHGGDRLSSASMSIQLKLARLRLKRWLHDPTDATALHAALRESAFTLHMSSRHWLRRVGRGSSS